MEIKKINEEFWVKIDTEFDVFNATNYFEVSYFNDNNSTLNNISPSGFEEIIRPITNKVATVQNNVNIGDYIINVNNNTLEIGDVFSDQNNNLYYIDKIDSDKLYIRNTINENIPSGTLLNEKGNTGIYKFPITMTEIGDYTLLIRNPTYGMQNVTLSVKIIDEDLDDINDKLDNLINNTSCRKNKAMV